MPEFLSPPVAAATLQDPFSDIDPKPVRTLKEKPKVHVPPSIVRLVQAALDGLPDPDYPDRVVHSASYTFPAAQAHRVEAFAKHLKNAELHTVPVSRVTVEAEGLKVAYRVGKPRGPRKSSGTVGEAQG